MQFNDTRILQNRYESVIQRERHEIKLVVILKSQSVVLIRIQADGAMEPSLCPDTRSGSSLIRKGSQLRHNAHGEAGSSRSHKTTIRGVCLCSAITSSGSRLGIRGWNYHNAQIQVQDHHF